MVKTILILLILFPLLNFLHEGGHWLGAKIVGLNPKMLLQRIDVGNETNNTLGQVAVYNWAGPFVNYTFFLGGYIYPPLAPIAFTMAAHRLGPNIFASILYLRGKTNFTNDETKQFPENLRVFVAVAFVVLYSFISFYFLNRWTPEWVTKSKVAVLMGFSAVWFIYLFALDIIDKKLFS